MIRCALCKEEMRYVHGHAACVRGGCPMFGVNQAECCSGETAACGPLTAEVAAVAPPAGEAPPNHLRQREQHQPSDARSMTKR